ncbi:undecaprenyldiphospho-muramoylpentapeptide beta-N-acetylglucosaminyltransferase [Elongatibacter sediminis]|uniref:UDP-N-acetylglucosamine--N-acetylmuramyl-(pentapeptide) pyrophosphoryl-undecaprenol N-acetylglucosamine transferase n=1 Tax=Elongatibacter sediminis TaxID=3119006 RepID=A0AAW9RKS9_9GAMM
MTREVGGVLIMAGGTGGHIFPGLAVAAELQGRGIPVRWLGASGGMECERVPAANIPLDAVSISGLRGKGLVRWLGMPWKLSRAVFQAFRVIGRHRPECAVSFGGYAAGPGGLAAWLRGVPLLVHEQNRVPGLTNRVLARFARSVLQAFPGSWPAAAAAVTCGNPVRADVVGLPAPEARMAARNGPLRVLVTGGSQGARALNEKVPAALGLLPESLRPQVHHQAGRDRAEETRQAYRDAGIEARVQPFIDDMARAYAWADLVVCRSGALTVSELAAAGIGAVLVPFPHAVDDHQACNADYLAAAGAAEMIREADCSAQALADLLASLLTSRERLLDMALAARGLAMPDSARRVADLCQEAMAS